MEAVELEYIQDLFSDDFLKGQRDAKNGVPHVDKSEAYTRGYATQMEAEAVATYFSERKTA